MKKRKIMMSVMSAALVGVVAIGGTLAYLSDTSNSVTNTFNVGAGYEEDDDGHVGLWLDEIDYDGKDEEGNPATRTETGNLYEELLPGSVVEKDPTFHLTEGSTESYVFAEVTGVDAMIEAGYYFTVNEPDSQADPAASAFGNKWKKVDDQKGFDGLYVYTEKVAGGEDLQPMFNWVKLGSAVENEQFAEIDPSVVFIRGIAVQTDNLSQNQAQAEAEKVIEELKNTPSLF